MRACVRGCVFNRILTVVVKQKSFLSPASVYVSDTGPTGLFPAQRFTGFKIDCFA